MNYQRLIEGLKRLKVIRKTPSADDIIQDALYMFLTKYPDVKNEDDATKICAVLVKNKSIDQWRKDEVRRRYEESATSLKSSVGNDGLQKLFCADLINSVQILNNKRKVYMQLRIMGYSNSEIAELININRKYVNWGLFDSRRKLRTYDKN
ncbi:MAG TPA: hypothetical protein VF622_14650 [Segetibacter sp.]|jgi:DNA-directed RNA polymerase specialized sigma24 family protein